MRTPVLAGLPAEGRLVVALSGGRDSVVLLHLLRFGGVAPRRLVAAHLDHGMREGSAADAAWVRGLCRAWRVPLVEGRLLAAPASEGRARAERWSFLEDVRRGTAAVAVLTAHHADDQVETVLHHLARGTGLRGLRGITVAAGTRRRPLLEIDGEELEALARRAGVRWREDPTNRDPAWTRNRIRHQALPALEAAVPGARRALLRLAGLARREEAALEEATTRLLEGVRLPGEGGRIRLDAAALTELGAPLRARLLRRCARELGVTLDARGTRASLAFTNASRSGSECHLTGGLVLTRELEHFVVRPPGTGRRAPGGAEAGSDPVEPGRSRAREIVLPVADTPRGEESLELPTGTGRIGWGGAPPEDAVPAHWGATLDREAAPGPLLLRPWRPGDRIVMRYGTKKLKKLLAEARLDRERRRGHPVLEDAAGRLVWVPGIPDAVTPAARGTTLHIWILHDARS